MRWDGGRAFMDGMIFRMGLGWDRIGWVAVERGGEGLVRKWGKRRIVVVVFLEGVRCLG